MTTPITFSLAKRAIRNYSSSLVSKKINRHNQRAWLKSVIHLGRNWSLHKDSTFQRSEDPVVLKPSAIRQLAQATA